MSNAPPEVSRDINVAATLPVDPTGVPNLDPVLGGGLPRGTLAPDGRLTPLRELPAELDADVLADGLLTALDQTGARRLVVDSLMGNYLSTVRRGAQGKGLRCSTSPGAYPTVLGPNGVRASLRRSRSAGLVRVP